MPQRPRGGARRRGDRGVRRRARPRAGALRGRGTPRPAARGSLVGPRRGASARRAPTPAGRPPGRPRRLPRRARGGRRRLDVRVERLGARERRLAWSGGRARLLVATDGVRLLVQVDGVPHVVRARSGGHRRLAHAGGGGRDPSRAGPARRGGRARRAHRVHEGRDGGSRAVGGRRPRGARRRRTRRWMPARRSCGWSRSESEAVAEPAAPPLSLGTPEPAEPVDASARYLAALESCSGSSLGFDVRAARGAQARRGLARARRRRCRTATRQVLAGGGRRGRAFADVQSLFSRARPPGADPAAKPPLEELWRYLHEPEARRRGARRRVRRVAPPRARPTTGSRSTCRAARSRWRCCGCRRPTSAPRQLPPVLGILERLASPEPPTRPDRARTRAHCSTALAEVGQERFPALADLAREVRYRRLRSARRSTGCAPRRLRPGRGGPRAARVRGGRRARGARRAAGRVPAADRDAARHAHGRGRAGRSGARLVETLLRRYYRDRARSSRWRSADVEGSPARGPTTRSTGSGFRAAAAFALPGRDRPGGAARSRGSRRRPRRVAQLAVELYVWHDAPVEAHGRARRAAPRRARAGRLPRPLRRVSFHARDPGPRPRAPGEPAALHVPRRSGRVARGPALPRRPPDALQADAARAARRSFELERLPSVEDVYLYRGVARGEPEGRAALRGGGGARHRRRCATRPGASCSCPHVERMLHEALAGMRRFQARRAPEQRLEWNRVLLTVGPPLPLTPEEIRGLAERLAPAAAGLGLEMALIDARMPDPATGELRRSRCCGSSRTIAAASRSAGTSPPTGRSSRWRSTSSASCSSGGAASSTRSRS